MPPPLPIKCKLDLKIACVVNMLVYPYCFISMILTHVLYLYILDGRITC